MTLTIAGTDTGENSLQYDVHNYDASFWLEVASLVLSTLVTVSLVLACRMEGMIGYYDRSTPIVSMARGTENHPDAYQSLPESTSTASTASSANILSGSDSSSIDTEAAQKESLREAAAQAAYQRYT